METIEIYKKGGVATKAKSENAKKELNRLQQDIESLKQWQEYYKTSGLHGQAALFEQKAKNLRRKKLLIEKGVPYPRLTKDQMEVLSSVYNRSVSAEKFSAQEMPSEVVKVYLEAKEYQETGVFKAIKVMYYEDDPILIGESVNEMTGNERLYLLARWGDGLKPWGWFVNHYLDKKRARTPDPHVPMAIMIVSIFFLSTFFLMPINSILEPFLLSLGAMGFAASAWALWPSVIAKFKDHKSYSLSKNTPIPSPFATQ